MRLQPLVLIVLVEPAAGFASSGSRAEEPVTEPLDACARLGCPESYPDGWGDGLGKNGPPDPRSGQSFECVAMPDYGSDCRLCLDAFDPYPDLPLDGYGRPHGLGHSVDCESSYVIDNPGSLECCAAGGLNTDELLHTALSGYGPTENGYVYGVKARFDGPFGAYMMQQGRADEYGVRGTGCLVHQATLGSARLYPNSAPFARFAAFSLNFFREDDDRNMGGTFWGRHVPCNWAYHGANCSDYSPVPQFLDTMYADAPGFIPCDLENWPGKNSSMNKLPSPQVVTDATVHLFRSHTMCINRTAIPNDKRVRFHPLRTHYLAFPSDYLPSDASYTPPCTEEEARYWDPQNGTATLAEHFDASNEILDDFLDAYGA